MNAIHNDKKLRTVLYSIYVAQFDAIKANPDAFSKTDVTRMLTSLMGGRPWSWRVIGITPDALKVLAQHDFERPSRQLQRGHKAGRSGTAQALYVDRAKPMPLARFFDFFLDRDETVIMTNGENRHRPDDKFPDYIPIDASHGLFPCGSLVGWQHRKAEVEFLRALYAKQSH